MHFENKIYFQCSFKFIKMKHNKMVNKLRQNHDSFPWSDLYSTDYNYNHLRQNHPYYLIDFLEPLVHSHCNPFSFLNMFVSIWTVGCKLGFYVNLPLSGSCLSKFAWPHGPTAMGVTVTINVRISFIFVYCFQMILKDFLFDWAVFDKPLQSFYTEGKNN